MRSLLMPKVGLSRQLAPELGGKIRKTPGRSFEFFAARLTLYDFVVISKANRSYQKCSGLSKGRLPQLRVWK